MIRARFKADGKDYRPVNWPVKHPFWCTGSAMDDSYSIVVAYADDEAEILRNWPEATDIEANEVEDYQFTEGGVKPRPSGLGVSTTDSQGRLGLNRWVLKNDC